MKDFSKETNEFWITFQESNPEYMNHEQPLTFYFCDNKRDADECADLVVRGIKRATSPSLWSIEKNNDKLPEIGDIAIVTDWEGNFKAIIKTTNVEIVKFKDVKSDYAYIEGEGDKSLEYWRAVHIEYYTNEMKQFGEKPNDEMDIVCEQFVRVW